LNQIIFVRKYLKKQKKYDLKSKVTIYEYFEFVKTVYNILPIKNIKMKKILILLITLFTLYSCNHTKDSNEIIEVNNNETKIEKIKVTTSIIPLASITNYIG